MKLRLYVFVCFLFTACAPDARTLNPQLTVTPITQISTPPIISNLRATRVPTITPALPAIQTPTWFRDIVLYEIFPRSFYDSNGDGIGDLKGITAKLDYIAGLGVGAIWLTPIFASPSYHGYDTTDYYKINPDFGTEDDLRELVREAHKRNLRVLLDYVVAHSSNQHPFFKDAYGNLKSQYADWFRWLDPAHTKYESFASNDIMPTWNHDNPQVEKYLIDVAKYWMQTGIDGYRADYVLNVPHGFWKKLRTELKAIKPDFVLLAEAWTNALAIKPYYADEFDATFDFPLYGDIQGSHDKIGNSILLGKRSPGVIEGTLAAEQVLYPPGAQRVEFLENHDTDRAMSQVNGNMQRAKLGAMLLLTLPGTPMIYHGGEIGMSGVKPSPPSDDKPLREPMDWYASESGTGMATWFKPADRNNKSNDGISVEEQSGKSDSLLEYYRSLIALRNANSALRTGAFEKIELDSDANVYAYLRQDSTASFVIVLNFEDKPVSVTLDLGATSLADGRYLATNTMTKQITNLDGLTFPLSLDASVSYLLQLTKR